MAHPEPGGNGVPALHPSEDPWDGAQIFEAPAVTAPRRARPNLHVFELVNWRGLLKVDEHVGIIGNMPAVEGVSALRHLFHCVVPSGAFLGLLSLRRGESFE